MPCFVLDFAEFAMVGRWLAFGHCAQNCLQEERFSGDAKICTVIWKLSNELNLNNMLDWEQSEKSNLWKRTKMIGMIALDFAGFKVIIGQAISLHLQCVLRSNWWCYFLKGYMLIVTICKMHAITSDYVQNILKGGSDLTVTYGVHWFKIYNNPITQCWMHARIWLRTWSSMCPEFKYQLFSSDIEVLPLWLAFMYPDSNLTICTILLDNCSGTRPSGSP